MARKIIEVEVLADDLTGKEILDGTGWVLTGIGAEPDDPRYHFQSLSNLLKALGTKAEEVFDMSTDEALQRMAGIRLLEPDEFACDGDCC